MNERLHYKRLSYMDTQNPRQNPALSTVWLIRYPYYISYHFATFIALYRSAYKNNVKKIRNERGATDSFLNRFLGRRKRYKTEKMLRKARKAGKAGKFLAFSRKKSRNFSFFYKFPTFSYFSTCFLAFLCPRKLIKKESVAPRKWTKTKQLIPLLV